MMPSATVRDPQGTAQAAAAGRGASAAPRCGEVVGLGRVCLWEPFPSPGRSGASPGVGCAGPSRWHSDFMIQRIIL